jgi:hypothetical protein
MAHACRHFKASNSWWPVMGNSGKCVFCPDDGEYQPGSDGRPADTRRNRRIFTGTAFAQ